MSCLFVWTLACVRQLWKVSNQVKPLQFTVWQVQCLLNPYEEQVAVPNICLCSLLIIMFCIAKDVYILGCILSTYILVPFFWCRNGPLVTNSDSHFGVNSFKMSKSCPHLSSDMVLSRTSPFFFSRFCIPVTFIQ